MRASLIALFTRNWPIKGAAICLSLMLYVAVQLQQPVTESFPFKLNVLLPPGRTLQQKPPTVQVEVSGKGSQLMKLRSLPGAFTRQVPDTLSGSIWTIILDPSDLVLPKGADVRVVDIRPRAITLTLDSVARKDVRIVPFVTVVPDSGQVLHGGISISPTIARLVGPEKNLATIESVTTIPTEIASVSGAFSRTVPIDTTRLGIVRISPRQVTVTGEMGMLAERTFPGVPVETGAGAVTSFVMTPARVSVTVRGPEARVRTLTRDSVRVIAHIARAGADGGVARITVIAPSGITARAIPDSVTLRRRTRRG
jgi:YbbR domain-containing protein